jgi:curved DNA-binding protein CbpA
LPEKAQSSGGESIQDRLLKIYTGIQKLNYFQILGVTEKDDEETIRKKFYERSRQFHPDRYNLYSPEAKEIATKIYKTIAEAYNILKIPKTRLKYIEQLKKDPTKIRYEPEEEKPPPPPPTGPGAKYYQMALSAWEVKNKGSALLNIKLALGMEPNNPLYLALKEEIEKG